MHPLDAKHLEDISQTLPTALNKDRKRWTELIIEVLDDELSRMLGKAVVNRESSYHAPSLPLPPGLATFKFNILDQSTVEGAVISFQLLSFVAFALEKAYLSEDQFDSFFEPLIAAVEPDSAWAYGCIYLTYGEPLNSDDLAKILGFYFMAATDSTPEVELCTAFLEERGLPLLVGFTQLTTSVKFLDKGTMLQIMEHLRPGFTAQDDFIREYLTSDAIALGEASGIIDTADPQRVSQEMLDHSEKCFYVFQAAHQSTIGPFDFDTVEEKIRSGEIIFHDMVCQGEAGCWKKTFLSEFQHVVAEPLLRQLDLDSVNGKMEALSKLYLMEGLCLPEPLVEKLQRLTADASAWVPLRLYCGRTLLVLGYINESIVTNISSMYGQQVFESGRGALIKFPWIPEDLRLNDSAFLVFRLRLNFSYAVLEALSWARGSKRAADFLREIVENSQDSEISTLGIYALAALGHKSSLDFLRFRVSSTQGHSDSVLGRAARVGLERFGKASVVELIQYTADSIDQDLKTSRKPKTKCLIVTTLDRMNSLDDLSICRSFRDDFLARTLLGKRAVDLYYRWSPGLIGIVKKHSALEDFLRYGILKPILALLSALGFPRKSDKKT